MAQRFITVKNFEKYNPGSTRSYPWIKLYRDMLLDVDFLQLDVTSRYLYVCLLILASDHANRIPMNVSYLSHRCAMDVSETMLKPLYRYGFLQASRSTIARLDKSREERDIEREKNPPTPQGGVVAVMRVGEFDDFWTAYPKKVGKEAARKAWMKLVGVKPPITDILAAVESAKASPQWMRDGGQYIPNPATWLNQHRWDDQPVVTHDPMKAMVQAFVARGE